jgi:hypothetical protein
LAAQLTTKEREMRSTKRSALGLVLAALGLTFANLASAEPRTYEWETVNGIMFSDNQAAIDAITGQTPFPLNTPVGVRYFVEGSMRGTFTYDPDSAEAPVFFPPHFWSHRGAMTGWWSELEAGGNVIGVYTGASGQVIVAEGDDAVGPPDDLINVNMCGNCPGATPFFVGDWRATGSSVVWNGEGFRDGIDLPAALPPANAPPALGIFSFFNPTTGENVSILSLGLDIRELVKVVDIDIKPGSDPNCFNINGHGVVPVAILGGADLDVADVDPGTLTLGGLEVGVRGRKGPMCGTEDVDGDGYLDLVCQFEDDSSAWSEGSEEATLTGELVDDTPIKGTDSICLRPQ